MPAADRSPIHDADLEAFRRDGIVCLRGLFSADWVDELRALVWDDANYLNRIAWQMVTRVPKELRDLPLALKIALRSVLALFSLQMVGTFLVLVLLPEISFQDGNPLLLTVEGEFVIKNLVLLSAGMVVGATVRRRRAFALRTETMERIPDPDIYEGAA